MNAQEIRRAYIDFFTSKQHAVIPRALLVPQNDPTTLFTGSGMQPLIPYLLGDTHPNGSRLVDSQTCLRAQDIEEIGDNRHTTFFEMLGNWSLGDYFKDDQLTWIFEFMIDIVGLNLDKFYVTCFIGDATFDIPKDSDSAEIWKRLYASKGVEAKELEVGSEDNGHLLGTPEGVRIFYYDASKNWWCRNGKIADMPAGEPGGPDSEMFYRFDNSEHSDQEKAKFGELCHPNCDCGRFMELGNNVFMEYVRTQSGFQRLPKQNVDHGSGLERIAAAALDSPDAFQISLLKPIIEVLERLSGKSYENYHESMRVITDHMRAATFLAVDGTVPSNKEQGYVMRRLIRRALRYAFELGIEQDLMHTVVPYIIDLYEHDFDELKHRRDEIIEILVKEEKIFRHTLRKGLRVLHSMAQLGQETAAVLGGQDVFQLYDTFGFPSELTLEEATRQNISIAPDWKTEFETLMNAQRDRSRTATKGEFKGGLGGQTEQHKKYHTATHLMYQSLRTVLGDHVIQHGSNITEERLRFDFSHPEKMTSEEIGRVQDMVNEQIQKDLVVTWEEHPTQEALHDLHVLGAFGDRYGDIVKVYRMQAADATTPFSLEICGGPHVAHTAMLAADGRKFKILKEESSSAGIRRIKAVLV